VILADGTHWASGATAIGTIAVAVVAVGVAMVSQRHSDKQLREEREHSDEVVAEERRLADKRLADQMRVENSQVLTQLEQSGDQFRELREKEKGAEQIAEAYSVQIVPIRMSPDAYGTQITTDPGTPITCPGVIVINRGRYAITRLQAQICLNGNSMVSCRSA
jgi:hypothetical protein